MHGGACVEGERGSGEGNVHTYKNVSWKNISDNKNKLKKINCKGKR